MKTLTITTASSNIARVRGQPVLQWSQKSKLWSFIFYKAINRAKEIVKSRERKCIQFGHIGKDRFRDT